MTPIAAKGIMDTPSDSSPSTSSLSDSSPPTSSLSVSSPQQLSSLRGSTETPYVFDSEHIHVRFCSSRDFIESSELADVQTAVHYAACLPQDIPEVRRCDATEQKPKRRSIWKRTKRFVWRSFCCAWNWYVLWYTAEFMMTWWCSNLEF